MAAAEQLSNEIVIHNPETEVHDLEQRTDPLVLQAEALVIDGDDQFQKAGDFLRTCKAMQKDVRETLAPAIEDAHRAHKTMTGLRSKLLKPLEAAEALVKRKMARFTDIERQRAEEEQRRIEAEARKQEEARRIEEAAELEARGEAEEAERVIEAPISIPTAKRAAPARAEGISTSTKYGIRVTDLDALIRAAADGKIPAGLVVANEKALSALARSLKDSFRIPGVELTTETVVSSRAK